MSSVKQEIRRKEKMAELEQNILLLKSYLSSREKEYDTIKDNKIHQAKLEHEIDKTRKRIKKNEEQYNKLRSKEV